MGCFGDLLPFLQLERRVRDQEGVVAVAAIQEVKHSLESMLIGWLDGMGARKGPFMQ